LILALLAAAQLGPATAILSSNQKTLDITSVLAISPVGKGGRVPFPIDPIQALLVNGAWQIPKEDDTVVAADGKTKQWKTVQAGKDGFFSGEQFEGGYSYCTVHSDIDRIMLLRSVGDSMVYVNGEPRMGDPYGYGYVALPIKMHQGDNSLLFANGRGQLKVQLETPRAALMLSDQDATLPDLRKGAHDQLGSVVVLNCTEQTAHGYQISSAIGAGGLRISKRLPDIPPLSEAKIPIEVESFGGEEQDQTLFVSVRKQDQHDETTFHLRYRNPNQTRKETYRSAVDGSVQYYAIVPPPQPKPGLALILSLHGASVEATGQADAYSPKDWAWIVCATNRRPFGFDWEDWGRQDGMDVLGIAQKEFQTDPLRTYVTGHSMGGHGTWQFGAIYPHHFAAIGVSAGWCSFFSYVGVPRLTDPTAIENIFQRANGTSATLDMKNNFKSEGVYILHGDADDNVPVSEARAMRDVLSPFQHDLAYHEQKGAGHWWDGPAAPGADCLEWPDMMEFLKLHKLASPPSLDFTTCDLAVNNNDVGVTVLEQMHPLAPSRIIIDQETITTSNISRFRLSPELNRKGLVIDGEPVRRSRSGIFARTGTRWFPSSNGGLTQVGPFKEVFNHDVVLVYGTRGTAEERRWAYDKARFDSEAFSYRGNASLPLISDAEYLSLGIHGRNVVLYGNADTNLAWRSLLGAAPIKVRNGYVSIGSATFQRSDLACLFCWRKQNQSFLVGAVAGTGALGLRLTDRLPYFVSGVGYPDWTIDSAASLQKGFAGVLAAGFFGREGDLASGEYVSVISRQKR